jgi:hypothetical protein
LVDAELVPLRVGHAAPTEAALNLTGIPGLGPAASKRLHSRGALVQVVDVVIQRVPEPKSVKNRVHLDVGTSMLSDYWVL